MPSSRVAVAIVALLATAVAPARADTDNNAADFAVIAPSLPQSSSSPPTP